jgi:hypothetical protein
MKDEEAIQRLCCGNAAAFSWLALNRAYVHAIDDLIDNAERDPEAILKTFWLAAELYTHPFFRDHWQALKAVLANVTNAYADSVAFERSGEGWKHAWADHWRHVGAEAMLQVAYICGGYENMRRFSADIRSVCHWAHHSPEGQPI